MPLPTCPNCDSTDVRTLAAAYASGTTRIRAMSVYVGSKGNHGVAPTFGSQQTVQASLSRPPKKKEWTAIGWFFLWGIAALVVLGVYAANNTELGDVPGLLFFLTLVLGSICSELHYEKATRYNNTVYAEEIRRWNNSYICDRCLTVFEADTNAALAWKR